MSYFFILGRNPELSIAELHAILPLGYQTLACSRKVLIVECGELEVEKLMRRLGGTVKIGVISLIRHFDRAADERRNLLPSLWQVMGSLPAQGGSASGGDFARDDAARQKLFLGLSAYALDTQARLPNVRELRELGMELKRELRARWTKVRLVTSKEIALSSVIVKKEKLLTQGAEIVLMYGGPSFGTPKDGPRYIGKTLAVQEFEEASQRDFGRPARGMKVGMLPIQLAKIMVNLARLPAPERSDGGQARAPLDATLLDPFCGFGTILAEARLMGYANLIGSDLEQRMIDATRKNLVWLFSNSRKLENVKLLVTPVEQLSKHLPPHYVDAIVTEPYLGPTKLKANNKYPIAQFTELYISAFREFAKILIPSGRVVFIFPAFKTGGTLTKTSQRVLSEIKKLGFTPLQLLPKPYPLDPSPSIIYSRPDQKVLREIFVFEYQTL